MKLTNRSEYALLALLYLSRQEPQRYTTVASIASAQGIPPKFLEQLLLVRRLQTGDDRVRRENVREPHATPYPFKRWRTAFTWR